MLGSHGRHGAVPPYLQHCPMENHLAGNDNLPPCASTSRAKDGVSSGRRATRRPPLSCDSSQRKTCWLMLLPRMQMWIFCHKICSSHQGLTSKLYSCCVISSPALRTNSSSLSRTGVSNCSKPNNRETASNSPKSHWRSR